MCHGVDIRQRMVNADDLTGDAVMIIAGRFDESFEKMRAPLAETGFDASCEVCDHIDPSSETGRCRGQLDASESACGVLRRGMQAKFCRPMKITGRRWSSWGRVGMIGNAAQA